MSPSDQPAAYDHRLTFSEWFGRAVLTDLLTSVSHSRDFNVTRSEYIDIRIRLVALVFSVLSMLWIPIDYLTLTGEHFGSIAAIRVVFSLLFLAQWAWRPRINNLRIAHLRLLPFFIVPSLFFVSAQVILGGSVNHAGVVVGYDFLPFLMIALMAIFPLTLLEGGAVALLCGVPLILYQLSQGRLLELEVLAELWLLALLAGIAIWVQLSQLHMLLRLYREATLDPLTGLANRRVLLKWIDNEIEQDPAAPLSVLIFDLDRFKRINDTYGHSTGDVVLRAFAQILRRELGGKQLGGRYGGEEFLALLPDSGLEDALAVAERIRLACQAVVVEGPDGQVIQFSTSIGAAQRRPDEGYDALLSRADLGLYQAKREGRNRTGIGPDPEAGQPSEE
jgi:diguanylate cyclase (GGDEF)-like protein